MAETVRINPSPPSFWHGKPDAENFARKFFKKISPVG
jgi:hypothetical protein